MSYDEKEFWNARYQTGLNSGDGSYGAECQFKVQKIAEWFAKYSIISALDLGCGDGNLFQQLLQEYGRLQFYKGVDISPVIIARRQKNATPIEVYEMADFTDVTHCDLPICQAAMCLDVLFHLSAQEKFWHAIGQTLNHAGRIAVFSAWNRKALVTMPNLADHCFYYDFPRQSADFKIVEKVEIPCNRVKDLILIERVV